MSSRIILLQLDTLDHLRQQGAPRGAISQGQRDLARATIVFTSAGVGTGLRTCCATRGR